MENGFAPLAASNLWKPQKRFGPILGPILGSILGNFLVIFGVLFWTPFWSNFGTILGSILEPILGPDRPKRQARRAQERHQELQRANKLHFQKPQKTLGFSMFLRSRGFPRGHHEPQESSQEPQKELQNIIKKESINGYQN